MLLHLLLFVPAVALTGPMPSSSDSTGPRVAAVPSCLVSLAEDLQAPAQESGPLVEVLVREGDMVQARALLARVDDEQAQLQRFAAERELKAAVAQAEDDINIRYSQAALEVAGAELQRSIDINRRAGQQTVSEAE